MKKQEQIAFVREMAASILKDVTQAIEEGKTPETWDGHELRVWLADRFEESAAMSQLLSEPRGKRAREYASHVLVNNL